MRLLIFLIQLSVFTPLLLGIDKLFRWMLGSAQWPGMSGVTWAVVGGGALALLASLVTALEQRKQARHAALRAGEQRRM